MKHYGGYSEEEYKKAERESFYVTLASISAFVAIFAFIELCA